MRCIKQITAAFTAMLMLPACTFPSSAVRSRADSDGMIKDETISFYENWKEKYLAKDEYVFGEEQYYIWYSDEKYGGNNVSVPVTVSEAHGYGMLIFAEMSEYDENAKEYFDGMYRYFKAHPSSIGHNLMSWQQCDNGTALIDGAEEGSMTGGYCDSAADGDIDIAYALLIADKVWGSSGEIDYLSEAKAVINDIMTYDINHEYWTVTLGDWVSECDSSEIYYHATRSSDFIVQYFPVFAEVSGDDNWMKVYDTTYQIIRSFNGEYESGLLPDFIIRDYSGKFVPAEPDFLEGEYDGCYSYNSCRTPWRISMDYLINGNEDAEKFAAQITDFIADKTGGDPENIMAGYKLDGTATEDYDDLCFTAPFLIAAACTDNHSQWHGKLRDTIIEYGDDVYYGDTIKLLCLIVDDGGWIVPAESETAVRGDINLDGRVDVEDMVLLHKYLFGTDTLSDAQLKNADLSERGIINCFDMVMLKRIILEKFSLPMS